MTTQTVAITNSTGTVWTFASTDTPSNTALGGRWHDLAFLMEGGPGGSSQFVAARPGVFSMSPTLSGFAPNGFFVGATGTGLQMQIFPGAAVIERGTYSGPAFSSLTISGTYPYVVTCKSTLNLTCDAANSLAGTRIDRVDLVIADGPGQSDNSGVSFAQVRYQAGVVSSGVAPNAPTNSIPLAFITFPAGTTTTLTGGMITDLRRSTAPRGAMRVMLPGDALADASTTHGEQRDTSILAGSAGIGTIDRWNSYTSAWDTQGITGAGSSIAKYTAAIAATGQNQAIAAGATTPVQFINARRTSPLVTASGTNNTTFTLNKAGSWGLSAQVRYAPAASTNGQFFQLVRNDTGEILLAWGWSPGLSTTFTYDIPLGSCDEYFTTTGVSLTLNAITGASTSGSIGSGTTGTGLRTFLTMEWVGA